MVGAPTKEDVAETQVFWRPDHALYVLTWLPPGGPPPLRRLPHGTVHAMAEVIIHSESCLRSSQEAGGVDVWEAAKSACASRRLIEVRGWRVEWRPRAGGGHSSYAHGGGKRGDLYLFPPRDGPSGAQGGRPIRSLSALGDVLMLRYQAQQTGGSVWTPPMRGSLVEVRLSEEEIEALDDGSGTADDESLMWRRAEVRKVELGLGGSFQVCVHTASGEPDESCMRWCTAWDECAAWRRIDGQPLFARTRPGKRRGRCGECSGCIATDCGRCSACKDKPKFGGPGTAKQACVRRRCINPTLPIGNEASAADEPLLGGRGGEEGQPPLTTAELVAPGYANGHAGDGPLPAVVNGVQLLGGIQYGYTYGAARADVPRPYFARTPLAPQPAPPVQARSSSWDMDVELQGAQRDSSGEAVGVPDAQQHGGGGGGGGGDGGGGGGDDGEDDGDDGEDFGVDVVGGENCSPPYRAQTRLSSRRSGRASPPPMATARARAVAARRNCDGTWWRCIVGQTFTGAAPRRPSRCPDIYPLARAATEATTEGGGGSGEDGPPAARGEGASEAVRLWLGSGPPECLTRELPQLPPLEIVLPSAGRAP